MSAQAALKDLQGSEVPAADAVCAGPTSIPVLHLHLLQRCNLSCLHCYSDSGPAATVALTRTEALGAVELSKALGYTHVAISGGEPLLSPHLEAVIARARALDQHVSIVTNGLQTADPSQTMRLLGANSVCVSLDGVGATHDALRRRPGAYERALQTVRAISDAGLQCGVSCGVTMRNLDELEAVVGEASRSGAGFINFHAVEPAGRAVAMPVEDLLDKESQTLLYVAANVIARATAGRCAVHCDLVHKLVAFERPSMLHVDEAGRGPPESVASQLGVLVVEPTGWLSPVCYGFDRVWWLGNLNQAIASGGDSVRKRLTPVNRALRTAGQSVLRELKADDDWVVLNPSAELARTAAEGTRRSGRGMLRRA